MTQASQLPKLNIAALHRLSQTPALYEPGEKHFWTDPYIAQQLLAAHLDPDFEAASRRPADIDAILDRLVGDLAPGPDAAWLDLGCGPGLYTARLAERGLHVTGVDFSQNSIAYAERYAAEHDLAVNYRCQNYLTLDDEAAYDVVTLIYGDFCPLFPADRAALLDNVHRALKPGGRFAFDVTTPPHHDRRGLTPNWYAAPEGGFWRPGPHLVLERGFTYPDGVYLDQHIVLEPDGTAKIYRFWYQTYTPDRITAELAEHGFTVDAIWSDLTGLPYTPASEWLGVVATRT